MTRLAWSGTCALLWVTAGCQTTGPADEPDAAATADLRSRSDFATAPDAAFRLSDLAMALAPDLVMSGPDLAVSLIDLAPPPDFAVPIDWTLPPPDIALPPPDRLPPEDLTVAPTCNDGQKNQGESDIDCGGPCARCGVGRMCGGGGDCGTGVCKMGVCVDASCSDNVLNGNESDIDCGGTCPKCTVGKKCGSPFDCATASCKTGMCAPPTCNDNAKNGDETDIDCGGSCPKCGSGKGCLGAADCTSQVCTRLVCAAATCKDGLKNGDETDIDCGGSCAPCPAGKGCSMAGDCPANADCAANLCKCQPAYFGSACKSPGTCHDLHQIDPSLPDGVYPINPDGMNPVGVYCDMTSDGGGYTLVAYASRGSITALCNDTGVRNLYSLATGGGTYDGAGRKGVASLAAVPIARLSTQILLARSDNDFQAGNILGYTVATRFNIPTPGTVNFLNSNPDSGNGPQLIGACTAVTLTTIVGPNVSGQTRYTFANTLSTTWSDTYPTGYGATSINNCTNDNSGQGPFFVSDYTGRGHAKNYCWPFDIAGGAYTYWYLGWWDPSGANKVGAVSIWLK